MKAQTSDTQCCNGYELTHSQLVGVKMVPIILNLILLYITETLTVCITGKLLLALPRRGRPASHYGRPSRSSEKKLSIQKAHFGEADKCLTHLNFTSLELLKSLRTYSLGSSILTMLCLLQTEGWGRGSGGKGGAPWETLVLWRQDRTLERGK